MLPYLRSLRFALDGLWHALKTERNLKLFTFLYVLSLLISGALHISLLDWEIVIFTGGIFLAFELINTAIEHFTDAFDDHVKAQNDHKTAAIKATKDIAAGASLVCAVAWGVILLMIFVSNL